MKMDAITLIMYHDYHNTNIMEMFIQEILSYKKLTALSGQIMFSKFLVDQTWHYNFMKRFSNSFLTKILHNGVNLQNEHILL